MKKIALLLLVFLCCSCSQDKLEITEIKFPKVKKDIRTKFLICFKEIPEKYMKLEGVSLEYKFKFTTKGNRIFEEEKNIFSLIEENCLILDGGNFTHHTSPKNELDFYNDQLLLDSIKQVDVEVKDASNYNDVKLLTKQTFTHFNEYK